MNALQGIFIVWRLHRGLAQKTSIALYYMVALICVATISKTLSGIVETHLNTLRLWGPKPSYWRERLKSGTVFLASQLGRGLGGSLEDGSTL